MNACSACGYAQQEATALCPGCGRGLVGGAAADAGAPATPRVPWALRFPWIVLIGAAATLALLPVLGEGSAVVAVWLRALVLGVAYGVARAGWRA